MDIGVVKNKITPSIKQQKCIQALHHPIMVLAGPGTGKTFTVIQRLKYMLEEGISPSSILCLTFSETAAAEMNSRLMSEVGETASGLKICTYHSFCNDVISALPEQFGLSDGVNVVDEITRYRIVRDIFEQLMPEALKTEKGDFYFYIKPVISMISEIKKSRTSKDDYYTNLKTSDDWGKALDELLEKKREKDEKGDKRVKTLVKEIEKKQKAIEKTNEVWKIFEVYQSKLKEKNYIDFDDMINFVLDKFESDEDFLQQVSSDYKYFLVDEYQDTNFSQNQLVFKLAQGANVDNVFVVGDDDQIIYGFQGAQSDNLEKFLLHYPNTQVICLDENRRSTQNILDLSYKLMSQDNGRLENNPEFSKFNISKKLTAKNDKIAHRNSPIRLLGFDDIEQEKNFIADEILRIASEEQVSLSEIVILVNKNAEAKQMAELLKSRHLDFQLKSNKSIFDIKASISLIFYLKALINPEFYADKLFGLLMCEPFDFHPEDYCFLLEESRKLIKKEKPNGGDFISLIRKNSQRNWVSVDTVNSFIQTYDSLKENIFSKSLPSFIKEVLEKTGIWQAYKDKSAKDSENLKSLERIIKEAANLQSINAKINLVEFLEHLDIAYQNELDILIDADDEVKNAVQIMTLHGSKGREFEYVFMCDLRSKKWEKKFSPNKLKVPTNKTSFDETSEQLRLMFVGMTRAKHTLYLTCPKSIDDKPQALTKYIEALCSETELLDIEHFEQEGVFKGVDEFSGQASLEGLKFNYKKDFSNNLKLAVSKITLSASSLNRYIDCPRSFLYSQIYKIPMYDTDKKALNYGDAIHFALEFATSEAIKTGNYPAVELVQKTFVEKIKTMAIKNPIDEDALIKRGEDALQKYYPVFSFCPVSKIYATEYDFGRVSLEDDIHIRGKVDRVEKNDDGTISIYDYKTGASKTGAGKIIDEEKHKKYLNQLRFYKLAFEQKGYKVCQVGLVYVEDFDKNYTIDTIDSDNEVIKQTIIDTYNKIQELNFEPISDKQNADSCRYCNYKMLCKLNVI